MLIVTFSLGAETVWHKSVLEGFSLAKKKNVPVIIDLYSDWCSYCKTLENEIFPSAQVDEVVRKYIAVRINGEEYPNLMERYKVRGYPTILILDKNGYFLGKITGLPGKEMIAQRLTSLYEKRNLEQDLLLSYSKNNQGVNENYHLGVYYYQTGDLDKSSLYFKTASLASDRNHEQKIHDSCYNLGLVYMDMERFDSAVNQWNLYLDKYKSGDLFTAYYFRGISFSKLGEKKRAIEDLKKASSMTEDTGRKQQIERIVTSLSKVE